MEVASYATQAIDFFAVDEEFTDVARSRGATNVVSFTSCGEAEWATPVVAAVGAPGSRRNLVRRWPGHQFGRVVAEQATISRNVSIGEGAMVAPGAVVMPGATLGRHVIINTGAVVSHECTVDDFATIGPGVNIGGCSRVAEGAFVGIGATISSGVQIGNGAIIGAGSVVIRDVAPFSMHVGVPARFVRRTKDWLSVV
ncbi:LbetaH domain-containing protein [Humibacter ginsengiterrae]